MIELDNMRCTHCQRCCHETEMELCGADVRRLERRGHQPRDFSELGEDGVLRLKNLNGFCFFFDKGRNRCREYSARPLGCRIYPVNIDADGEVVVDSICPVASSLSAEEIKYQRRKLIKLLAVIDREADKRSHLI